MKLPKHPTLLRRMRDARLKQLSPRCPPLAASLGRQAGGGLSPDPQAPRQDPHRLCPQGSQG